MDNLVVISSCSTAVQNDLAYIFDRATRLAAFEFHPHSAYRIHDDTEQRPWNYLAEFNPGWMFRCTHVDRGDQPEPPNPVADAFHARLRSGIRELDLMSSGQIHFNWECSEAIIHIHDVLHSAANTLVVLKLGVLRIDRFGTLDGFYALPLVFPTLEELYVFPQDEALASYVCRAWVLPHLTRLTVLRCRPVWPDTLLAVHGQRLRYLHLFPDIIEPSSDDLMALCAPTKLAEQCPELRHLVLPALPWEPLPLRHPRLRYLDVWSATMDRLAVPLGNDITRHPVEPSTALRTIVFNKSGCSLPALRGVRLLLAAQHTLAQTYAEWPTVCDPEVAHQLDDGAEELRVRCHLVLSAWVVQMDWGVLALDNPLFWGRMSAILASMGEGDDDDDEEEGPLGEGTGEEDFLGGVQPDRRSLRAVLEEQELVYSEAAADADYVVPEEESDSGSDSGSEEWDNAELTELYVRSELIDRAPQVDRNMVLEAFRRGLRVGVLSEFDE
ncbi:hypothetical protein TRAPUB_10720 [Trametes pubescens]|uniref:F-box domain-containing protein n=1 Tax=Trametes pubescens TaxID=154538 RepID=A0A1M2VYR2_TRAPU|nr:hypothetical protein TRAPUB_10720 [Trametes pubescens]